MAGRADSVALGERGSDETAAPHAPVKERLIEEMTTSTPIAVIPPDLQARASLADGVASSIWS